MFTKGGQTTIFDESPNAFGYSSPGLSAQQELDFFVSNSFFNLNWVTAPSSTTVQDGLGPLFNTKSCSGCHFKDGRGAPIELFGEAGTGYLVRLSLPGISATNAPIPDPLYGEQIQDQSIAGVPTEDNPRITYTYISGTFPDGTPYELRSPAIDIQNLQYSSINPEIMMSARIAQQMIGLGLLEAIRESDILALSDEHDQNHDGISGRPNWVWNFQTGQTEIGRFGWKSNQPNLYQQAAGAFLGDIGITSGLFLDENCTSVQLDCQSAPNGGVPEIPDSTLEKVVLYVRSLAVPAQRNYRSPDVINGRVLFLQIGCGSCHRSGFITGPSDISALSGQYIFPYSDLLLHDMGPGLADNRPDFVASGSEWRTQPLWGIALIPTVNGHTFFLHDGRARNLTETILWHGGESELSKNKFMQLNSSQRQQIICFLESL